MSEKIIPNGDYVAMRIIEQHQTPGGIIIPEKSRGNQRDAELAEVTAVGKGRTSEYGAFMPVEFQVGDHVLIPRAAGVQVETEIDGKPAKVRILRAMEILSKVEESRIVTLNRSLEL